MEYFLGLILIFAVVIGIVFIQRIINIRKIHLHIEAIGGRVVSVKQRVPMMRTAREMTHFDFQYELNGEIKDGKVRFWGIMPPKWEL